MREKENREGSCEQRPESVATAVGKRTLATGFTTCKLELTLISEANGMEALGLR